MKRINGYLDISEMSKISNHVDGFFCVGWFTDGENEYLFKAENDLMIYKELFYSKVIKKIGLESAKYDLAQLKNINGVITENYNLNHSPFYTIEEVMNGYCLEHDMIKTTKYNLKELPSVIKWFCKEKNWIYQSEIEKELYLHFIIQILLGDSDLKSRNMEIQYNEDQDLLHLSPFYDFNFYGNINLLDKYSSPYLFLDHHYRKKMTNEEMLQNFLKTVDRIKFELLKEYLEKLKQVNLDKIIEEIREQTEISMDDYLERKLINSTVRNLKDISNVIKKEV